jgi:hypothetical protein
VKVDWYRNGSSTHMPDGDNKYYSFMHIVTHGNAEDIATTPTSFAVTYGTSSATGKPCFLIFFRKRRKRNRRVEK